MRTPADRCATRGAVGRACRSRTGNGCVADRASGQESALFAQTKLTLQPTDQMPREAALADPVDRTKVPDKRM
jgi:hypothetical protein